MAATEMLLFCVRSEKATFFAPYGRVVTRRRSFARVCGL